MIDIGLFGGGGDGLSILLITTHPGGGSGSVPFLQQVKLNSHRSTSALLEAQDFGGPKP